MSIISINTRSSIRIEGTKVMYLTQIFSLYLCLTGLIPIRRVK